MSTEETTSLSQESRVSNWQKILKICVWPAMLLILAGMFSAPLSRVINNPERDTKIKLSSGGIEIISKAVTNAARKQVGLGSEITPGAQNRADQGARHTARLIARLRGRAILWIDDHPENNVYLYNAFAEAGVRVFSAFDNAHARELLAERDFDLAITDVGRDVEGLSGGLTLLPLLQTKRVATIVYSASWSSAHRGQEREYGVIQITNDPTEVYSTAIAALSRAS